MCVCVYVCVCTCYNNNNTVCVPRLGAVDRAGALHASSSSHHMYPPPHLEAVDRAGARTATDSMALLAMY